MACNAEVQGGSGVLATHGPGRRRPCPTRRRIHAQDLGIPTANVDAGSLAAALAEAVTGIYAGWASIGTSEQVRERGVWFFAMSRCQLFARGNPKESTPAIKAAHQCTTCSLWQVYPMVMSIGWYHFFFNLVMYSVVWLVLFFF